MRKPRSYSIKEVYNATYLGFVFEFYCSKKSQFVVEDLKRVSRKNVVLTDQDYKPTYSTSILLKEYDGKRPRYQFKVGYQPYKEIPTFLNMILFWINENASLDYSTLLKVNLLYNFNELQTLTSISNMDVGKMVLKIDEEYMNERFPETEGSPFSMSIKKLIPFNMSISASNVVNLRNNFKMPIAEYYGVDFTKQTQGELTFNYIGGPEYSDRIKGIYEVLEYYILTTYQVLNSEEDTPRMVEELNKLTEEYRTFRKCYYNVNRFMDVYKDFTIYVDLNKQAALVESHWFRLRDVLAKLILESNIKQCKFNLDTEFGNYQIKDSEVSSSIIKGFQIINSNVSGIFEDCRFWKSKIENSRIVNSTLVTHNEVTESYLQNVRADRDNKIDKSYIVNTGEIINCKVNESIIKNAGIGDKAKLDEECLVINSREKQIPKPSIPEISEIKDYKWIKSLRDPDYKDKGYGNEYKEDES